MGNTCAGVTAGPVLRSPAAATAIHLTVQGGTPLTEEQRRELDRHGPLDVTVALDPSAHHDRRLDLADLLTPDDDRVRRLVVHPPVGMLGLWAAYQATGLRDLDLRLWHFPHVADEERVQITRLAGRMTQPRALARLRLWVGARRSTLTTSAVTEALVIRPLAAFLRTCAAALCTLDLELWCLCRDLSQVLSLLPDGVRLPQLRTLRLRVHRLRLYPLPADLAWHTRRLWAHCDLSRLGSVRVECYDHHQSDDPVSPPPSADDGAGATIRWRLADGRVIHVPPVSV